jgi:hypothetical protein
MRWVDGKISPIGGWSKYNYTAFASPLRAIHRWTTQTGLQVIAYLCEAHLYVDLGNGLQNISPTVAIVPPSGSVVAGGYGDNTYNLGLYNTPRPNRDPNTVLPPIYRLDNWGENLLAMTSNDGRLLMWNPNTPSTAAAAVAGAPINNRDFIVAPQRFVILFGAGGVFNKYQWCDEEDITNWSLVDITSKGGDFTIQPASPIVTAALSGSNIVVFTANNNGFVISFIGMPYIWSTELFQSDTVPMSPKAIINTPQGCVWASLDGFWYFSGGSAVPLPCSVWQWVDDRIDEFQARFTADFVILPTFSELYFFFPSKGSLVNDLYVVWNYKDGWWGTGKMKRACGVKSTYIGKPIMSDGTSVFEHESGSVYSLVAGEELPWARTYNFNLAGGAMMMSIGRMLADIGANTDGITFQMDYQTVRSGQLTSAKSAEVPVIGGFVGFRDTGRDFQLTIRQKTPDVKDWTFGDTILDTIPRGRL